MSVTTATSASERNFRRASSRRFLRGPPIGGVGHKLGSLLLHKDTLRRMRCQGLRCEDAPACKEHNFTANGAPAQACKNHMRLPQSRARTVSDAPELSSFVFWEPQHLVENAWSSHFVAHVFYCPLPCITIVQTQFITLRSVEERGKQRHTLTL